MNILFWFISFSHVFVFIALLDSYGVTAFAPSTAKTFSGSQWMSRLSDRSHRNDRTASLFASTSEEEEEIPPEMGDVGFVLLAGGKGSRMKADIPKQFLELRGVPILHHSLDLFLNRLVTLLDSKNRKSPPHLVLVMDESYRSEYRKLLDRYMISDSTDEGVQCTVSFADPGVERQGSVENGVRELMSRKPKLQYAAIHDSARPLVTLDEICNVIRDAKCHGAAVLGVPCKATIKECDNEQFVVRTIPRSSLWEVHTPQVIELTKLLRGFDKVRKENLEVTDDVSIVEQIGEPVKLTLGEYTNLKITTPEDLDIAEKILEQRRAPPINLSRSGGVASSSKDSVQTL
jgi:2-C-methyl-D-erythritol 4-phosphate cytidylyltransferase